jgi:FAD-linked sulfhydryl oxidase
MGEERDSKAPENKPKGHLPPGVVLGPDGKPCKVCTAFRHWNPSRKSAANSREGSNDKRAATATAATTASDDDDTPQTLLPEHCPPDAERLGRATWTFLHTTAAYYPERPTPSQRVNMLGLLHALPVLYPCSYCAVHLGESMREHPPDVSGRARLSRWLCERHNEVNERLGKDKFDCDKTQERWRDGPSDGSCD